MTKYVGRSLDIKRNTTGATYVSIGQVLEAGLVGSSRDQVDMSAFGDSWKDYGAGMQEGAEVTLRIAYDPANAQHTGLKADYDGGTSRSFQYTNTAMPVGNSTATFPALVTEWLWGGTLDGAHEVQVTLKIVNPGVTMS